MAKPKRRCPFCDQIHAALSRHIRRKHKDIDEVKQALLLPAKQRNKAFSLFKNNGILAHNLEEIGKEKPTIVKSRKSVIKELSQLNMCNVCKVFIERTSMARHRRTCTPKESFGIDLLLLKKSEIGLTEEFKKHVLCTIRNDKMGLKCKRDEGVLLFGFRLYDKSKKRDDNIMGCRKDVRSQMRILAHLHAFFVENNTEKRIIYDNIKDMFLIVNFDSLRVAVDSYTTNDDESIKAGLKTNLQFVLIKAAKIFRATALTNGNKQEADGFGDFLSVLNLWKVNS